MWDNANLIVKDYLPGDLLLPIGFPVDTNPVGRFYQKEYAMFNLAFWNDFISTLTGAIIGIPIALWLSNFQQTMEQRARKSKILLLLEEELQENINLLKKWEEWPDDFMERSLNLLAHIKVKLWNAFSDGGELEWIQNPRLLGQIADAYNDLKMVKELCEKYIVLIPLKSFPESQGSLTKIRVLVNDGIKKTIRDCERTIKIINQSEKLLSDLNWYERLLRRGDQV